MYIKIKIEKIIQFLDVLSIKRSYKKDQDPLGFGSATLVTKTR
jgi:hypothetical protein